MFRYNRGATLVASLEDQLLERNAVLDDLKANIIKAQQYMKSLEDGRRRELEFQVGDQVFLKLQPYRQKSLALRANEKLSPRFYGPFVITHRVGKVAYRLDLPASAKIHNVFHISQLKKMIGDAPVSPTVPPQISTDLIFEAEPEAVLNVRHPLQDSGTTMQVLIQWKSLPPGKQHGRTLLH